MNIVTTTSILPLSPSSSSSLVKGKRKEGDSPSPSSSSISSPIDTIAGSSNTGTEVSRPDAYVGTNVNVLGRGDGLSRRSSSSRSTLTTTMRGQQKKKSSTTLSQQPWPTIPTATSSFRSRSPLLLGVWEDSPCLQDTPVVLSSSPMMPSPSTTVTTTREAYMMRPSLSPLPSPSSSSFGPPRMMYGPRHHYSQYPQHQHQQQPQQQPQQMYSRVVSGGRYGSGGMGMGEGEMQQVFYQTGGGGGAMTGGSGRLSMGVSNGGGVSPLLLVTGAVEAVWRGV